MNEKIDQTVLAKVNEYIIQKKTDDGSMTITLPKQFVVDNRLVKGDRVVIYRNGLNPRELVVRVEKLIESD